jgi:hypothetical protein
MQYCYQYRSTGVIENESVWRSWRRQWLKCVAGVESVANDAVKIFRKISARMWLAAGFGGVSAYIRPKQKWRKAGGLAYQARSLEIMKATAKAWL